jgi:hypothetical protein
MSPAGTTTPIERSSRAATGESAVPSLEISVMVAVPGPLGAVQVTVSPLVAFSEPGAVPLSDQRCVSASPSASLLVAVNCNKSPATNTR